MELVLKTAGLLPDDLESSESNSGGYDESSGSTIEEASQEDIHDMEDQVDTEELIPTGE